MIPKALKFATLQKKMTPIPPHSQPSDGPFNTSDAEVYILLM